MEKTNKVCLAIIITCTVLVIILCSLAIIKHNREEQVITDAVHFKNEFEAYNELDDYLDVDIPEDNPFVYKTPKQILDILKNERAVVFFGYASNSASRAIIKPLLEVAGEYDLDTIYYVDIKDIRDEYVHGDSIMPDKTKEGTQGYYDLVKFLGKSLEKYYVRDEYLNQYDTTVRRIFAPTVVAVNEGKVQGIYDINGIDQDGKIDDVTVEIYDTLVEKYTEVIKSIKTTENLVCTNEKC